MVCRAGIQALCNTAIGTGTNCAGCVFASISIVPICAEPVSVIPVSIVPVHDMPGLRNAMAHVGAIAKRSLIKSIVKS